MSTRERPFSLAPWWARIAVGAAGATVLTPLADRHVGCSVILCAVPIASLAADLDRPRPRITLALASLLCAAVGGLLGLLAGLTFASVAAGGGLPGIVGAVLAVAIGVPGAPWAACGFRAAVDGTASPALVGYVGAVVPLAPWAILAFPLCYDGALPPVAGAALVGAMLTAAFVVTDLVGRRAAAPPSTCLI
jgi:hypothetical protein